MPTTDDAKLEKLLKEAVVEVLEERRYLVSDAVAEAVEDIVMVRAIREGTLSENTSRGEVFNTLRARR